MLRDQRISDIAKHLGHPHPEEKCRVAIEKMIAEHEQAVITYRFWHSIPASKEKRQKVERVGAAAKVLLDAIDNLPPEFRLVVPDLFPAKTLELLQFYCDSFKFQSIVSTPSKGGDRRGDIAYEKRSALVAAEALLVRYKIPRKTTRKSVWCKIAALIHGEGLPPEKFHHACRGLAADLRHPETTLPAMRALESRALE